MGDRRPSSALGIVRLQTPTAFAAAIARVFDALRGAGIGVTMDYIPVDPAALVCVFWFLGW